MPHPSSFAAGKRTLVRYSGRSCTLKRGDGKDLYKSPPVGIDSRPLPIDVDVRGVKELELEVVGHWQGDAASVDWANIRLEK